MDIKPFTESHPPPTPPPPKKKKKKNDASKKDGFYGRLIFLLWYKVKSLKTFGLLPFNTKNSILSLIMEACNISLNNIHGR